MSRLTSHWCSPALLKDLELWQLSLCFTPIYFKGNITQITNAMKNARLRGKYPSICFEHAAMERKKSRQCCCDVLLPGREEIIGNGVHRTQHQFVCLP